MVELPGTTAYAGDLPHEILMSYDAPAYDSLGEWLAPRAGWFTPNGQNQFGLRNLLPGIFFDGIPYPFASAPLLNWLPMASTVEFLDFPAAAWWGRKASGGAVQLTAPANSRESSDNFSVWGGSGGTFGVQNYFKNNPASLDLNFLKGTETGDSGPGRFEGISKIQWVKNDSFGLESGVLTAQNSNNDNWTSASTSLNFYSPNFQTLQVKPYIQTAQLNGVTAREWGSFLNYHLNLGGIAESQMALGYSRTSWDSGLPETEEGFVQAGALADVLGMMTLDAAFRFDFSSAAKSAFSYLLGLQGTAGELTLLGDCAKGVSEGDPSDALQLDLGFRYQPDDGLSGTLKYLHEDVLGRAYDGGRALVLMEDRRPSFFLFKKAGMELDGQMLVDSQNNFLFDRGGKVSVSFFGGDDLWVRARFLSFQPVYWEGGADYALLDWLKIFGTVSNLEDLPVAWPDPALPPGRVFHLGMNGRF